MDYKKIIINITLNDVFDIAKLKTGTVAAHIKDGNGNSQEQSLAITDAERGLWDVNVMEYADKVYNYLMQAGKIKQGTYLFNVSPIAFNDAIGVVLNTTSWLDVSGNDEIPVGATYTYSLVGALGGAKKASEVTITDGGFLTYTPSEDQFGLDKVNYQVTIDGISYFASVYVNIAATSILPDYPASSSYAMYTLYLHADWDINLAQGLSNLIQKALVSGGMFEWFKATNQFDIAKVYQQEYLEALEGAKQNINRRIYTIRRPHVTF